MRTMRYVGQVDYLLGMHALTMSHPDKEDYVVAQFTPARAGTLCYGWTPFMRACFEEVDTVRPDRRPGFVDRDQAGHLVESGEIGRSTVRGALDAGGEDWIDVTELGSAYEAQFDPLTNRTRHRPLPRYDYGADGRVVKASGPEDWIDGPAPDRRGER